MNRTPSLGGTLKLVQLFLVVLVVGFQRDCLTNSFLFRSRRGTSIRILVYDGQGFWLCQKRLSKGRFVWWPTGKQAARVLEAHQAQLLLAAGEPETAAGPGWRGGGAVLHLRFQICRGTLRARGVETPRPDHHRHRHYFHPAID